MFTVLHLERENPRGWARLIWRLHPPQPELVRVAVKSGAPFFILRVRTAGKEPPWDEILYMVGRCASRILTDTQLNLPKSQNIRMFIPRHLPLIAAMYTMADVLRRSQIPPQNCKIGVYDPLGTLCGRAETLLQCASDVRVCTTSTTMYDEESRRLMRLCGAGLTVGETTELFRGCNILLCTQADILPANVFAFACQGTPRENVFLCSDLHIPEPYRSQVPEGVDPTVFASALYELCGVRSLAQCRFGTIRRADEILTADEAAKRLQIERNGTVGA